MLKFYKQIKSIVVTVYIFNFFQLLKTIVLIFFFPGKQLGSGAFGVVLKGEADGILEPDVVTTVAVKMVKQNVDETHIVALASELKIMIHLGRHLNVVNLLAACTRNLSNRKYICIIKCTFTSF